MEARLVAGRRISLEYTDERYWVRALLVAGSDPVNQWVHARGQESDKKT